jgi:hypothetical protein
MSMACLLTILFSFASLAVQAQKFDKVDLENALIEVDGLTIRFQHAGFPDVPHMEAEYFLRLKVENRTDQPSTFEPKRFRIVDAHEKKFDVKEVMIRMVEGDQKETLLPGDSREYAIVFGPVRFDGPRPTVLYYKEKLLGEITR